ncbi:MAG: CvpA family protein [Treponema sp.]
MNVLDIIFLCILLGFTFIVYMSGFIKEVFSKLAFIVGGLIAVVFSPYFALDVLRPIISIKNNLLLYIISFLCLFSIVYLIIKIIGSVIGFIFEFPILKSLDRSLGAILGLLEGSIIVFFIIELMVMQSIFPCDELIANSKIATFFVNHILTGESYTLIQQSF